MTPRNDRATPDQIDACYAHVTANGEDVNPPTKATAVDIMDPRCVAIRNALAHGTGCLIKLTVEQVQSIAIVAVSAVKRFEASPEGKARRLREADLERHADAAGRDGVGAG